MLALMLLQTATTQAAAAAPKLSGVQAISQAVSILAQHWFAYGGEVPMRFFTFIDYHQYFIVSCFIFCIGFYGVIARRNAISMLLAMELMLNAVNINMSAFNDYWGPVLTRAAFTSEKSVYTDLGQCFSAFAIIIAAAEAAIGLGIIIAFYRMRKSIMLDDANLMKW
jgi:NADH:ubiquinone oxidoreductase subunit K